MLYLSHYCSPIGKLTIVSDERNLVGLWIDGQKHFMAGITGSPEDGTSHPLHRNTALWLDAYFAGQAPSADHIPMAPMGTPFQQAVWEHLRNIPYGEATTYGQIAREIARQMRKPIISAQAVGNAVGRNPISILIPCHRVIGAKGKLTGYDGGLDKKEFLLKLEGFLP